MVQTTEETLAVIHVKWYYTSNSLLEWIKKRKRSFNLPTEEVSKIQRRFLDRLGSDELVLTSDSDYIDIQTVSSLCQVYQFDDSGTQEFIPNNMPYFRYELDFERTMTESKDLFFDVD
ncbi:hypothetical protein M422DRAFT_256187 [Sphaerobolus stellatus SS14]|uniref:BAH domain-containing protein n=1 Tax=Sphaerobolus stellatus (strain SS14) TaxID=990650 RepID=A0A0C9VRZ0_SPHS4|nr:hypothetical protein M422DRAFT_256187 [Sphaerobolus stellatus SS14]